MSTFIFAGVWPVLILCAMVVLVAAIALFRAERKDVPKVFAAFAAAFGFRTLNIGVQGRIDPSEEKTNDDPPEDETDRPEEAA